MKFGSWHSSSTILLACTGWTSVTAQHHSPMRPHSRGLGGEPPMASFPGSERDGTCGSVCNFRSQDYRGLASCLKEKFANKTVSGHGKLALIKDSCKDGGLYNRAMRTSYGFRHPTAVVFAENTQDVVDTVNCARETGHRATARGRGHSYGGWGSADGAVVIDMQYTCDVDAMVDSIDRTKTGPHIVPGTNYIATITAQAGCSNANWLAGVYLGFDESEGALASIGSCPSVGIVGYSLGGGLGDVSPIAGYGLDLITEYEMVLADGSVITASEDENEDLYWANRGGGGGIGVITSLTFKVLQTPSPGAFTFFLEITPDEGKVAEWFIAFQSFLYDHPQSYRFGGGASIGAGGGSANLVFLGKPEEGIEILADAGLLDEEILNPNYLPISYKFPGEFICVGGGCPSPVPAHGISFILEFPTNGHTQAYISCLYWLTSFNPTITQRSFNVCEDLGVDDAYCECVTLNEDFPCQFKSPNAATCAEKEVIEAILENAADPTSFISRHGFDVAATDFFDSNEFFEDGFFESFGIWPSPTNDRAAGGFVMPRLEDETFHKLAALDIRVPIGNHLAHGAANLVPEDATAMPWRNSAFNVGEFDDSRILEIFLQDKAFGGSPAKLQGYYSYIGPQGFSHWEQVYFGSHVEKLKGIKAKYDPTGVFDKPMQLHGSNVDSAAVGGSHSSHDESFMQEPPSSGDP